MNPTRSILSSAVLPLRLTFADGYQLLASAAVVGANDLLTATHVLYQPQHGGWATGLALLGTQVAADGQIGLTGEATPIDGWQVWANPQQVYADNDPATLTLGESQYDVALIGVDRQLNQTGLTLAEHAGARQGSGLGYAGGQRLSGIDTGLQHGQDGYSVWGSTDSQLGPGSSGGPLLDESGQLIGVNSAGTPGSATWWADIGPFLPQITAQMQANDGMLQATGPFQTGPVQISTGTTLPDLPPAGQETVAPQLPNATPTPSFLRITITDQTDPTEGTPSPVDDKPLLAYVIEFNALTFMAAGLFFHIDCRTMPTLTYRSVVDRINESLKDGSFSERITASIDRNDPNSIILMDRFGEGFGSVSAEFVTRTPANTTILVTTTEVTNFNIQAINPFVAEGSHGGTTAATFTVTRGGSTDGSASVNWAFQPGTATADDLNGATSGTVTFAAGETSKAITLFINADTNVEPNETFSVVISNATNGVIGTGSATQTINNDDSGQSQGGSSATQADSVLYRFAKLNGNYFYTANPDEIQYIQDNYLDMMRFEGYAFNCLKGSGQAVYRYALLGNGGGYFYTADAGERQYAAQHPEAFRAEGVDGSGVQQPAFYAALNNDQSATPVYRLKNGNGGYLFTASEAEKNAAVSLYGYTFEQIAFKVPTAGTPSGFALAAGQDSQFAAEGTGTGGSLKYNVIRIGDSSGPASVQWSIVKGAGANPAGPDDFSGGAYPGGTLSFGANETSKIITVPFSGDNTAEFDETFYVTLSNPQGEQVLVGSMAGRIVNDDASSGGGNHAPATAAASVTLGNTSGYVFKVADFPFSDVDGDTLQAVVLGSLPAMGRLMLGGGAVLAGTSVSRADLAAGKLAYSPAFGFDGQTSFAFQVTDATLASASADMVLKVGDQTSGMPALSIKAQYPAFTEGSGGGALPVPLDITRSSGTGVTTVEWAVVFGTADSGDFSGSTSGSVTFAAGETSKTITLQVNKDSNAEANETFSVQLKNPVNATLATGSANETILDDDSQPASTFQFKSLNKPAQASEGTGAGNEGSLSYDVLRTGDLQAAGSVKWQVVPAGADPAEANDFLEQQYPSGTLQFAANEGSKTITVTFAPDELKGGNETFKIQLSDAVNGIVSSQAASMDGTILNDDTSKASKDGDAFEGDPLYALQFGANEAGWGHGAMDGGWLL